MSTSMSIDLQELDPGAGDGAVRVAIDRLVLAFPERDLKSVESALDVVAERDGLVCGRIAAGLVQCPVYALGADLAVAAAAPATRRACMVLDGAGGRFGLLADDVTRLPAEEVRRFPMPPCMRADGLPVESLVVHEQEIQLALSAASLSAWIARAERVSETEAFA